jgi:hypothetical protein
MRRASGRVVIGVTPAGPSWVAPEESTVLSIVNEDRFQ